MDTISNMIIQIKNAGNAGHNTVEVPFSKLNQSIAEVLKKEGFVKDVAVSSATSRKGGKTLTIELFIENRVPKIKGVTRISKPSKRIYKKYSELRPIKSGYGALIVSTPAGVMSGRDAKRQKLGGEALFNIW
jgi:small subunit ribosomal protein S8